MYTVKVHKGEYIGSYDTLADAKAAAKATTDGAWYHNQPTIVRKVTMRELDRGLQGKIVFTYRGAKKNPGSARGKKNTPWIPVKAIRFRDGKLDLRVSKAVKRSMVGGARLGNPDLPPDYIVKHGGKIHSKHTTYESAYQTALYNSEKGRGTWTVINNRRGSRLKGKTVARFTEGIQRTNR